MVDGAQTDLAAALAAGVETLGLQMTITFKLYKRIVLPADGFVFWCLASNLSPGALSNSSQYNELEFNAPVTVVSIAPSFEAPGYLHHTTTNQQAEDESFSLQRFIFTSLVPVDQLSAVAPDEIWIAHHAGYKFAFSQRSMFSRQANLYHYAGDSLYPSLATQVVDDPSTLLLNDSVVSNSLPVWLTLNSLFPLYPSFLVPDNITPPYASVHIGDADTTPIQAWAQTGSDGSRYQLVKDIVRITTYGVRKDAMLDFLELVGQFTLDNPSVMGLMNSPVPRDAKRGQTEFSIIAQKKIITFDVNYYQSVVHNFARQLILKAFVNVIPAGYPILGAA
jgi:hypothetical protein